MSVEQLQMLSMAGYIASGGFLVSTVLLFFILKIPRLIEDMTGVTARRAIEDIRRQNEGGGRSGNHTAVKRKVRGSHTDKISSSGRQRYTSGEKPGTVTAKRVSTGLTEHMRGGMAEETTLLMQGGMAEETALLMQGGMAEETSLLMQGGMAEETSLLMQGGMAEETSLLMQEGTGTAAAVLQQTMIQGNTVPAMAGSTEELSQHQALQDRAKASVVVQVDIGFSESSETVD